MTTLLEKAKSFKIEKKNISDDDVQLAIAWLKGEVITYQVAKAYGLKGSGNIYSKLAVSLKSAFNLGRIIEKETK